MIQLLLLWGRGHPRSAVGLHYNEHHSWYNNGNICNIVQGIIIINIIFIPIIIFAPTPEKLTWYIIGIYAYTKAPKWTCNLIVASYAKNHTTRWILTIASTPAYQPRRRAKTTRMFTPTTGRSQRAAMINGALAMAQHAIWVSSPHRSVPLIMILMKILNSQISLTPHNLRINSMRINNRSAHWSFRWAMVLRPSMPSLNAGPSELLGDAMKDSCFLQVFSLKTVSL